MRRTHIDPNLGRRHHFLQSVNSKSFAKGMRIAVEAVQSSFLPDQMRMLGDKYRGDWGGAA